MRSDTFFVKVGSKIILEVLPNFFQNYWIIIKAIPAIIIIKRNGCGFGTKFGPN